MKLMTKIVTTFFIASFTFSAWAISLADAKQQGLVGEMPNGYLGAVKNSAEVSSLVKSVNDKRKSIYQKLAKKNNLTIDQVSMLAGKKAIAKTQSGHMIKNSSGKWTKK